DFTTDFLVTSVSDVQAHASQVGADTVINLGGADSLTLKNVTKTALVASDFSFSTALESFGSTRLMLSNNFYFAAVGGASGVQVKYNGAGVVSGQFGAFVPFAAEQLAGSGYEVAWRIVGADQYAVWNTDANGNLTSSPTGIVSGSDLSLQSLEPGFQQDRNGAGIIGFVPVMLEQFGATKLSQVGNTYMVSPVAGGSGPQLKFNGAPVTAGFFGAWVPFAAEQIAGGGYELAW